MTILDDSGDVSSPGTPVPSYALEFACRTAGRDLTADEWRTYVGDGNRISVCPQ